MAHQARCPPLSSSSKFSSTNCLQRMTSTASNTFIEEENIDLVNNTNSTAIFENVAQAAAAKISGMINSKTSTQKFTTRDGYTEFSVRI